MALKDKFESIKNNKTLKTMWEWKHCILLGFGAVLFLLGMTSKSYLTMFLGLILVGFGVALWSSVSKYLFKIPGLKNKIGAESLDSIKISEYGVKTEGKEGIGKITAKDFLDAMVYGERKRDKSNDDIKDTDNNKIFFYNGIRYQFTENAIENKKNSTDKKNIKESESQLNTIYTAYNQDKKNSENKHDNLKKFFKAQILDYISKKIEDENRLRKDKNSKGTLEKLANDQKGFADQNRAIDDLAERMARAFKKYLDKSPDNRFKPEDFGLDNEGKTLDNGKDYLIEFLEAEMMKESTRGKGGYIKFGFFGAGVGAMAGFVTYLVSMFKPDVLKNLNNMYNSIGMNNMSGPMGILFGAIFTAMIFVAATYVYNNKEPDVPERLSNHTQAEQKKNNTITPVINS